MSAQPDGRSRIFRCFVCDLLEARGQVWARTARRVRRSLAAPKTPGKRPKRARWHHQAAGTKDAPKIFRTFRAFEVSQGRALGLTIGVHEFWRSKPTRRSVGGCRQELSHQSRQSASQSYTRDNRKKLKPKSPENRVNLEVQAP